MKLDIDLTEIEKDSIIKMIGRRRNKKEIAREACRRYERSDRGRTARAAINRRSYLKRKAAKKALEG